MTTIQASIPRGESRPFVEGWKRLAQAVICQAAIEAAAGSQEAAAWLADPETANFWLIPAGIDTRAVSIWVKNGCKRANRKPTKQPLEKPRNSPRNNFATTPHRTD